MSTNGHDRPYLQSRIFEEIDRHHRYGHPFSVVIFEAHPVADGLSVRRKVEMAIDEVRTRLRPSDIVARAFEDTVVVLFVETDARGAKDALIRLRSRLLNTDNGGWTLTLYSYPADAAAIGGSALMNAA